MNNSLVKVVVWVFTGVIIGLSLGVPVVSATECGYGGISLLAESVRVNGEELLYNSEGKEVPEEWDEWGVATLYSFDKKDYVGDIEMSTGIVDFKPVSK